jgi:LEA14-like dessication related protein
MKRTLILAALAVGACATTGPLEPPRVTVTDVTIDSFAAPDARFTVQVRLANPNLRELAVDAVDAELRLENFPIGTAALAAPVRVPPLGDVTASIVARADLVWSLRASAEIARRLREERLPAPVARYAVTGTVTLQGGGTIPFSRTGEFRLPSMSPAR